MLRTVSAVQTDPAAHLAARSLKTNIHSATANSTLIPATQHNASSLSNINTHINLTKYQEQDQMCPPKLHTNIPIPVPAQIPLSAQYTTNNRLKIHARTHSGERPYKCTQCAYSAVQKCTLDSHMVTMHTSESAKSAWRMERLSRAVPCGVCAKMFKTRASLESHAWRFHGAAPTVKAKQD
ncbi:hypothetical protein HDU77_007104 [Chytriomyces hyalinus]|nr:hypothetical protein HDU77_007104 [Chytriomyces hyalinus]